MNNPSAFAKKISVLESVCYEFVNRLGHLTDQCYDEKEVFVDDLKKYREQKKQEALSELPKRLQDLKAALAAIENPTDFFKNPEDQ